jgi:hypothetical protein
MIGLRNQSRKYSEYKQTVKNHYTQKKGVQLVCILKNANKLFKMKFFKLKYAI